MSAGSEQKQLQSASQADLGHDAKEGALHPRNRKTKRRRKLVCKTRCDRRVRGGGGGGGKGKPDHDLQHPSKGGSRHACGKEVDAITTSPPKTKAITISRNFKMTKADKNHSRPTNPLLASKPYPHTPPPSLSRRTRVNLFVALDDRLPAGHNLIRVEAKQR